MWRIILDQRGARVKVLAERMRSDFGRQEVNMPAFYVGITIPSFCDSPHFPFPMTASLTQTKKTKAKSKTEDTGGALTVC